MSTEIGNNTQFQATTPQEKVALEVSNFVTKMVDRYNLPLHG